MTTTSTVPRARRRRLAVGVVLAALAALVAVLLPRTGWTLATWTAAERSGAGFEAGIFQSQSQAAGSTEWTTHPVGSPVTLSLDGLTGLAPGGDSTAPTAGEPRLVWLNLRTGPASTWSGQVRLTGSTAEGALAPALEYRVVSRAASTDRCTAADLGTGTPVAGSDAAWQPAGTVPADPVALPVAADAGDAAGLCLAVRVAADAAGATAGAGYQGAGADLGWTFTLSQDPATA
ncbi:MAG TPA: hypothetical protein VGC67_14630 [Cellulomonas sp.]